MQGSLWLVARVAGLRTSGREGAESRRARYSDSMYSCGVGGLLVERRLWMSGVMRSAALCIVCWVAAGCVCCLPWDVSVETIRLLTCRTIALPAWLKRDRGEACERAVLGLSDGLFMEENH